MEDDREALNNDGIFPEARYSHYHSRYNAWDIEAILAPRAPDCVHSILPASLRQKAKNNDEYRRHFQHGFLKVFRNFQLTIMKEIHDFEARTCAVHAKSTANTPIGPYANEYTFVLTFAEDSKILRIEEFVDSAYIKEYLARLEDWTAAQSARAKAKL